MDKENDTVNKILTFCHENGMDIDVSYKIDSDSMILHFRRGSFEAYKEIPRSIYSNLLTTDPLPLYIGVWDMAHIFMKKIEEEEAQWTQKSAIDVGPTTL